MPDDNPLQPSGFLVVRLSEMNRDPAGRYPAYPTHAPRLGNVFYGGIDRMPWFDIEEEFYEGTLPVSIRDLREAKVRMESDFTGIHLCTDFDVACSLLQYSNRHEPANELIVLRSGKLAQIKGTISLDGSKVAWLGYDIVSLGNWSLLSDGLFKSPGSFPNWETLLNRAGLVNSPARADELAQAYQAASLTGAVEPLPDAPYGIDVIEVGRVRADDSTR